MQGLRSFGWPRRAIDIEHRVVEPGETALHSVKLVKLEECEPFASRRVRLVRDEPDGCGVHGGKMPLERRGGGVEGEIPCAQCIYICQRC